MFLSRRSALHIFLIALSMLGILFGMPSVTKAAEAGPDWMNGDIAVTRLSDHDWVDSDQYTYGNIPCEKVDANVWGWQTNGWNSWKVKSTQNACVTAGASGYMGWRAVLPFGGEYWQQLNVTASYYNPWTYPNSGTNGMVLVTNAYPPYSSTPTELYYTEDVFKTFNQLSKDSAGNVVRSLGIPLEHKLAYPDGRAVNIQHGSGISFSANGRWMYVDAHVVGQLRIDTRDFSVTSFASGYSPYYSLYTAISNSGSTVATYEYGIGLKLYDITRCEGEKPNYGSRNCVSRDITQLVRDQFATTMPDPTKLGNVYVSEIKFLNESQIRLLVQYQYDGQNKAAFMGLKINTEESATRYLALGDSFSSGEGAGNYYEVTNFWASEDDFNLCHQSRVAYSELLNKSLSPDFYDSVACSGAVMEDVVYTGDNGADGYIIGNPQARNPSEDDDFIQYIKNTNQPGYIPQLSLVKTNLPTVSTMSIGGNNIGFKDIIVACATQAACYSTQAERRSLASLVDQKINDLAATYRTVKENLSGANPKLYIIGYPKLFNDNNLCGDFMSGQERQFANALVEYLNAAIKIAANQAGVRYIDVSDAFYDYATDEDHRLCGNSYPAANGLLVDGKNASDTQKLVDYLRSSYHPNALGHSLLAVRIRQLTNDFNFAMPSSTTGTGSVPSDSLYQNLVGAGRTEEEDIMTSIIDGGTTAVLSYGSFIGLNLNLGSMALPVLTGHVTVQLHSDPITLGTLPVSSDGTISGSFSIPTGVQPGSHQIHILYTDITGQNHDLIKHIYIVASMNDFDGDGLSNDQEECVLGGTMGIDRDKDGTDDACDQDISEKVVVIGNNSGGDTGMTTNKVSSPNSSPTSPGHGLTNSNSLTVNLDPITERFDSLKPDSFTVPTLQPEQNRQNNEQIVQNAIGLYLIAVSIILFGAWFTVRNHYNRKQL